MEEKESIYLTQQIFPFQCNLFLCQRTKVRNINRKNKIFCSENFKLILKAYQPASGYFIPKR